MINDSKKKYNLSKTEEDVLTSIVKLGSSLKSTEGEKEVKYAMTLNPELFSKPHMVHLICNILSIYKFKYNIRKRILQLVDKNIRNNELDDDWEYYL